MRLRKVARALRDEPLRVLVGEAAWRGLRSVRRSIFKLSGPDGRCPVRFHPIGYDQLLSPLASEHASEAIIGYADASCVESIRCWVTGAPISG